MDESNDSDVDLKSYFETADFKSNVSAIKIFDHFETNLINTITEADIQRVLEILSGSVPAVLSNDQYQQIGEAQRSGKSFMVIFELNDSTKYKLYIVPSLSVASIGDNRYTIPNELVKEFGELFVEQSPLQIPMY